VILFIVIGMVILVSLLAVVVLKTMQSNSRHTLHRLSRIKAYYAVYSGMLYAFDQIRGGVTTSFSLNDADIPYVVGCTIGGNITAGDFINTRRIDVWANYDYNQTF
jgi:hypothetical protein